MKFLFNITITIITRIFKTQSNFTYSSNKIAINIRHFKNGDDSKKVVASQIAIDVKETTISSQCYIQFECSRMCVCVGERSSLHRPGCCEPVTPSSFNCLLDVFKRVGNESWFKS